MEPYEKKKERLAIRRELNPVLEKIMLNKELESILAKIILHKRITIDRAPLVEIGGCHAEEIKRIEEVRRYMGDYGERVIKTLSTSLALFSKYSITAVHIAFTINDAELSAIAQKLADCNCNCGEYVGPI